MVLYYGTIEIWIKMREKHQKTLAAIFKIPVQSNVVWKDCEKLLEALGAEISEGAGSRVRILLNDVKAVFHRPHPRKETDKGALVSLRRFLETAGIRPKKEEKS
jgi:HicA toxin of bacterial toxin-antitoxin,